MTLSAGAKNRFMQASLSVNKAKSIMGLLAQFNTILRLKSTSSLDTDKRSLPQQPPKINVHALGLYNWAIKDTGLEVRVCSPCMCRKYTL